MGALHRHIGETQQVRGVAGMIEDEQYRIDVFTQISSVTSALRSMIEATPRSEKLSAPSSGSFAWRRWTLLAGVARFELLASTSRTPQQRHYQAR